VIILTEACANSIRDAIRPLLPTERTPFLEELFETLLFRREPIGEGELARQLRTLQRTYFKYPTTEETSHRAPWHEGGTGQRFK
jgi:hypothetical protein